MTLEIRKSRPTLEEIHHNISELIHDPYPGRAISMLHQILKEGGLGEGTALSHNLLNIAQRAECHPLKLAILKELKVPLQLKRRIARVAGRILQTESEWQMGGAVVSVLNSDGERALELFREGLENGWFGEGDIKGENLETIIQCSRDLQVKLAVLNELKRTRLRDWRERIAELQLQVNIAKKEEIEARSEFYGHEFGEQTY